MRHFINEVTRYSVGVVIIGGIKSIAEVTENVVPFMAAIYVGAAVIVIAINFDRIDDAFAATFNGAFTGEGVAGGVIDFSDTMNFAMALVNIVGLYILVPEIKRDLADYLTRLNAGQLYKVQQRLAERATDL